MTIPYIDYGPFQRLLKDLANEQNHISVRLELGGVMWMEHFSTVFLVSRRAFLLTHTPTRSVINIPDINQVTGFEIDGPHKLFLPYQQYAIDPLLGWIKMKKDGQLHA